MRAAETRDHKEQIRIIDNAGSAYAALGDTREAIKLHERALVMARETHRPRDECTALHNLGRRHFALGNVRRAIELHQQALVLARQTGILQIECETLYDLAIAFGLLKDVGVAIRYAESALKIALATESPLADVIVATMGKWRRKNASSHRTPKSYPTGLKRVKERQRKKN